MAGQAPGVEHRALPVAHPAGGAVPDRLHPHLQPGQARQPHLRAQPQQLAPLDLLHPPEVQRVAHPQPPGVAAAPAQSDPAGQPVQPAAHGPRQGEGVPAVLPADALDDVPQRRRLHLRLARPYVGVEAAARPVGVGGQRVAGRAGCPGRRPAGGDLRVADPLQRERDRAVEAEGMTRRARHVPFDVAGAAHHFVPQRLGERPGDPGRDRRHQAHPVARQAGGEHGHRQDQPPRQARHGGVAPHHVEVRQHLGAADVEGAADLAGQGGAAGQQAQHVAHGDRLDPGVHPARGDHHRQPLGEVAQHLEAGGARADDDRRAQHDRRHAGGEQDAADLGTGPQVRGQLPLGHLLRRQPAEIHEPAGAGLPCLLAEDPGRLAVGVLEVPPGPEGVHEVVGHVHAPHGPCDGPRVGHVAPDDADPVRPLLVAELLRGPHQAPHLVPGGQEFGNETAADVAARARHQAHQGPPVRVLSGPWRVVGAARRSHHPDHGPCGAGTAGATPARRAPGGRMHPCVGG